MSELPRIGYIGLGAMGMGMAGNLLKAGFEVTAYDVRADVLAQAVERGARAAGSPGEVGASCDIVAVNVRTPSQVEQVLFGDDGEGGVVGSARPGTIVLIHSTISPGAARDAAQRSAQRSVRVIDAPVVGGGQQSAIDGTLTVILAGDAAAIAQCDAVVEAVGSRTFVVGEPGTAQVAKIVNNVLAVVNGAVIAETLALASAAGLDIQLALDIVNAGSGASFLSQNRDAIRAMVATSDMKAISAKDLAIALEFAKECGVQLPLAALATQYSDAFLS
jgi:3-hydroxyisobutyrate dehydrogenase-like beta-hydroxyacid dehydrogenase